MMLYFGFFFFVAHHVYCGTFFGDPDERFKAKIFGSMTDEYTAKFEINKAREYIMETIAESSDKTKFIEGDLKITPLLIKIRAGDFMARKTFATDMKWKSNIIPYVLDSSLTKYKKGAIEAALKDFEKYTVIRFTQRTNQTDYINFIKRDYGCWSFVGCQGGMQDLNIGKGCRYRGTVIHEIMHALGFFHEHTRMDRDKYLSIETSAINPSYQQNFIKYESNLMDSNMSYDYFSIMQLDRRTFSRFNVMQTIKATDDAVDDTDLGQRLGFSEMDVARLNMAYGHYVAKEAKLNIGTSQSINLNPNPNPDNPNGNSKSINTTSLPGIPEELTTATTILPPIETARITTLVPGEQTTTVESLENLLQTTTPPKIQPTQAQPQLLPPPQQNRISSCQPNNNMPCWPNDYVWSYDGLPPNCNCGGEQADSQAYDRSDICTCNCVKIHTDKSSSAWKNNLLCFKDKKINPNFEVSLKEEHPSRKCVKFPPISNGFENAFLCIDPKVSYQLYWSNEDKKSCLKIVEPDDEKWGTNFLCDANVD